MLIRLVINILQQHYDGRKVGKKRKRRGVEHIGLERGPGKILKAQEKASLTPTWPSLKTIDRRRTEGREQPHACWGNMSVGDPVWQAIGFVAHSEQPS
jgi:hypothetical protein